MNRTPQSAADEALVADQAARAARAAAEVALRKRIDSAVALDHAERRFADLRDDLHAAHRAHAETCAALEDAVVDAIAAAVAAESAAAPAAPMHGRAA